MPQTIINIIEISTVILYGLAAATFATAKNKKSIKTLSHIAWVVAVILNATIVANNWYVNGYVPFVSMYQVITFLALIFAPIYIFIRYFGDGGWMKIYFCVAAAVCMLGVCFMGGGGVWHFPPALQSVWFVPHILAYMVSYSLVTVAFIITVISFTVSKSKKEEKNKYSLGVYNLMVSAFPFMTMGMLFGAIWADAVWGEFWSFDAKENWSLVTWMMVVLYLHFRREKGLNKYAKAFVILAFVALVVTMFFVNFMGGSSSHTYSTGM